MFDDDDYDDGTPSVDEYMREELGWGDIDQIEDNDWEQNIPSQMSTGRIYNPVNTFCDGPYARLAFGCYHRLSADVGSEEL